MTRTVNANSVKIVVEDSKEGILLSISQDGKLVANKIDEQGNVDNQTSALTSNFISLTDTPEAFQAEKYLKVNAQGNALEFSDISISTNFISLTDTPNAFKAGSYLRVNTAGDAIEQIKTAPPDGGVGDNSEVQMYSNFAGKLPDSIIAKSATGQIVMGRFYHINSPNEDGDIHYSFNESGGNQYMAFFKNDPTGTNARFSSVASSWQFFDGATTLQDVIDSGNAIYHGQKSGTSGVGSLSAIKSVSNFYTELPDEIICANGTSSEVMLRLTYLTDTEIKYEAEDHGTGSSDRRFIHFHNTANGDLSNKNTVYWTTNMSDNTLRWYIENGRALYHGHTDNTGSAGASSVEQLTDVDVTTTPPSAGQVLVYDDADSKWKPGAQSNEFVDLTDTPSSLDAGSYLRVNTAGDAIEQIKTAPPDGGRGGNSLIQEKSKFAGKLPDAIIAINGSYAMPLVLRSVYDGDTSGSIEYMDPYGGGSAYVAFYNNPTGDGLRWITTGFTIPNGRTSLQAIIDDGNAVFHGQKSGTSGAGSLSVIKAATDNFYTDLPDAIVATHAGGYETIMCLKFAKSLTDQSDGQNFYYEARFDTGSPDYLMVFKDDEDGTFMGHAGQSDNFPANGSMDQTLRWYIENGRALYHGSDPVTSRIGQLEDIKSLVPLANQIDIPDAIVVTDSSGQYFKLPLVFVRGDTLGYDHNNGSGTRWYIGFSSTDGAYISNPADANVVKEYSSLQDYISNGRALFYGRTGSNLDQLIGDIDDLSDVDTSTTAPSAGQVLVYDDTDSKWKPGAQSTDFTDLTDTPETLDAGSYLRVNAAGDAVEQVKIAPPDGGAGDDSAIQTASNFAGKLPDQIVVNYTDSGHTGAFVFSLRGILEPQNEISYHDEYNDSGYRIVFNNDATGTFKSNTASLFATPHEGATASLQDIIDGGHAIYHGQKSGTSGVGSLSYLKSLANSSPNGGFYTELPDAIVAENTSDTYLGVFKLHWIDLNTTAGGTTWEVIYRAEAFSSGDYYMGYLLDADGTKVVHSGVTHANPTTKNLRWFIENGRAIYNGGYNESNVVSARIGANGTILSSNYDWIQSVTATGGSYAIVFKPGHFTSPPAINVSADVLDGVSHIMAEYNNLTKDTINVVTMKNNDSASVAAEFCIMAQHQDRPVGLAAPQYSIKAWGVFDGTQGSGNNRTITGFAGGNVASIVRISTGLYKVTFINPMPHADYSISGSCNPNGTGGSFFGVRESGNPVTATDFHIELRDNSNGYRNSDRISFQVVC